MRLSNKKRSLFSHPCQVAHGAWGMVHHRAIGVDPLIPQSPSLSQAGKKEAKKRGCGGQLRCPPHPLKIPLPSAPTQGEGNFLGGFTPYFSPPPQRKHWGGDRGRGESYRSPGFVHGRLDSWRQVGQLPRLYKIAWVLLDDKIGMFPSTPLTHPLRSPVHYLARAAEELPGLCRRFSCTPGKIVRNCELRNPLKSVESVDIFSSLVL